MTGGAGADVSGTTNNPRAFSFTGVFGAPSVILSSNTSPGQIVATFNGGTYTGGNGGNASETGLPNRGGVPRAGMYADGSALVTITNGTFAGGTGGSGGGVPNGLRGAGVAAYGPMVVNGGTLAGLYVGTGTGLVDLDGGRFTTGEYIVGSNRFTAGMGVGNGGVVNV